MPRNDDHESRSRESGTRQSQHYADQGAAWMGGNAESGGRNEDSGGHGGESGARSDDRSRNQSRDTSSDRIGQFGDRRGGSG